MAEGLAHDDLHPVQRHDGLMEGDGVDDVVRFLLGSVPEGACVAAGVDDADGYQFGTFFLAGHDCAFFRQLWPEKDGTRRKHRLHTTPTLR